MRNSIAILGMLAAATVAMVGFAPHSGSVEANPGCTSKGPVLGVSRTIEIDTTNGPRYGNQQYPDHDILADGEVILTFDDGPLRPYTMPILQALDRHCTKATFFVVGSMALADPQTLRETARRGHTIGTHTWSHQYQLRKTNIGRAQHEIELGLSAVQRALGAPVAPMFRFPFLSDSRAALEHLKARNIGVFSIDVDSLDYRAKGPDGAQRVFDKVMGDLAYRKKGILLFHDIQPSTAAALPRLLDALKAKGFRVVHMVAKGQATTLAQYDSMVETEAKRRRLAIAAQPLAPRAVTWTLPAPGTAQPPSAYPPGYRPHPGPPLPGQPIVAPPAQPAIATPTAVGPGTAVEAQAPPPPRPRFDAEPDWRTRVFNQ